VFAAGKYTLKIGKDQPNIELLTGLEPKDKTAAGKETVVL
jgi:hypothetical protein